MIFRWLDTSEVTAFGTTIVDEYCRLRGSVAVQTEKAAKQTQRFEKLVQKAAGFSRERELNFYKKARFINTIRTGLLSKQIPEAEVDTFVKALLFSGLKSS